MRVAFIETLEALAKKDKNIFLLNGDLGFSVLENFTKKFPTRSLNMGVAEANMIGAAAGLAMSGKMVFVYSIIPFVTARVFEQIRNDIGLQRANVKIVGVGSGFTYGQLGPTHHSLEDIALMRLVPGMTVFAPGDPWETRCVTRAAAKIRGPVYLRIGKKGEPQVHTRIPAFRVGRGILLKNGKDITLAATGNMLAGAVEVARLLEARDIHARLLSLPTIKPLDTKIIIDAARITKAFFTLEEHSVIGGLGSAIAEVLLESKHPPSIFHRFGVHDVFTIQSGSQEYLRTLHGLNSQSIARVIQKFLTLRK